MTYQMKWGPEAFWAVLTAGVIAVSQVVLATDPTAIADWRIWLISAAGAVARAIVGTLMDATS